jgi:hypothetical protein
MVVGLTVALALAPATARAGFDTVCGPAGEGCEHWTYVPPELPAPEPLYDYVCTSSSEAPEPVCYPGVPNVTHF